jgi:hypothetical protein
MKKLIAVLLVIAGCESSPDRIYQRNDLQLLTHYAAKELCSCLFVMERDRDFCTSWTRQAPNLRTYSVDYDNKRVTTQAVLYWGASARYQGPRHGCVLE